MGSCKTQAHFSPLRNCSRIARRLGSHSALNTLHPPGGFPSAHLTSKLFDVISIFSRDLFVNSDAELLSARILHQRKNRRDLLGFVLPIYVNIAQYIFLFFLYYYSRCSSHGILASAMWKFSVELTQTAHSLAEWFRDGQFSMAHYIREVLIGLFSLRLPGRTPY